MFNMIYWLSLLAPLQATLISKEIHVTHKRKTLNGTGAAQKHNSRASKSYQCNCSSAHEPRRELVEGHRVFIGPHGGIAEHLDIGEHHDIGTIIRERQGVLLDIVLDLRDVPGNV